jgi:hypothetical protein
LSQYGGVGLQQIDRPSVRCSESVGQLGGAQTHSGESIMGARVITSKIEIEMDQKNECRLRRWKLEKEASKRERRKAHQQL